jgi:hypothetical protein
MIEKVKSPWRQKDTRWNEDREVPSRVKGVFRRVAERLAVLAFVAVIVGSIGAWGGSWLAARSEEAKLLAIETEKAADPSRQTIADNGLEESGRGTVLGENDIEGVGVLASENYRVGQIVLGGDVGVLSQGDEYTELAIADIRGETLGSKNQNEGRALLTWKTSKAARSTLRYGKTAGGTEKTIEEDALECRIAPCFRISIWRRPTSIPCRCAIAMAMK